MKNICIVTGARPNFIKVAPLIKAINKLQLEGQNVEYKLVYAGKIDDSTLEQSLFDDLQIPPPHVYLGIDCESLNELTGRIMFEFDNYLNANPMDMVIVVDDLTSTMAAAIVTKKRGLPLAHIVAGTRSFDINMPKEINRLVIDSLSDYLFTAGANTSGIAMRGGQESADVYLVGNILMDTLRSNYNRLKRPEVADRLALDKDNYLLFTINRKVLINDHEKLSSIIEAMCNSVNEMKIIAPLREPASSRIKSLSEKYSNLHIVDPLPYLEFAYIAANAKCIVTDSGNVAEEATFNSVPCITINNYTEHIETVTHGSNVLIGEDMDKLKKYINEAVCGIWKKCTLPDRWDGRTGERIIKILLQKNNGKN